MPETAKLLAAHPVEYFSFHCECDLGDVTFAVAGIMGSLLSAVLT
jgi:hypothetical protein